MLTRNSTFKRIKRSLRGCRPRLSLQLCLFEEEYCLDLFGFLIALPFMDRWHREPNEIMEMWGLRYGDNYITFSWGDDSTSFRMPWDWEHCNDKYMVLREDGTWEPCKHSWDEGGPDNRFIQEFPYVYILKDGTVQNVTAKVYVNRREWRRRFIRWIPWFAKKRQSIDVEFSDEVGERAGSWKGGCIGCGYEMKKGETAEQTLRRMERERKFK